MTSRILIDANVFIYAQGRDHPLKGPSVSILELVAREQAFFTNAEVFQELLHRYISLRQWPAAHAVFIEHLSLMQGRIEPMFAEDVELAASLAALYPLLSARDLVHVAVMYRVGATHVVSADSAFDVLEDVERLHPLEVNVWRERVRDVTR